MVCDSFAQTWDTHQFQSTQKSHTISATHFLHSHYREVRPQWALQPFCSQAFVVFVSCMSRGEEWSLLRTKSSTYSSVLTTFFVEPFLRRADCKTLHYIAFLRHLGSLVLFYCLLPLYTIVLLCCVFVKALESMWWSSFDHLKSFACIMLAHLYLRLWKRSTHSVASLRFHAL